MSCMTKMTLAACAVLLLSGCAMYRLEELRHTTPQGTPFQDALARLYMDFATQEEKTYAWADSWYFADKGLTSAYGHDVAPEELADWDIPKDKLPELERARAQLMAVLTPENEKAKPDVAAKAQFYFDCWVKEQEANWQGDNIAYCRDGLHEALAHLHGSSSLAEKKAGVTHKEAATHQEAEAVAEPDQPKEPAAPKAQATVKESVAAQGNSS